MLKTIFTALAICFCFAFPSAVRQPSIRSAPLSVTRTTDGDPIDLFTGLYIRTNVDIVVPDTIPIKLERTYRNADRRSRAFGIGASHPYDMFIVGDAVAFSYVELILADGGRLHYDRISPGKSYSDGVFEHTNRTTEFFRSRINWIGSGWTVSLKDGSSYKILGCSPSSTKPGQCGVIEHRDAHGNVLTIERQPNGNITRIVSPNKKWVAFTYDSGDRVIRADSSIGRSVQYQYDQKGRLVSVVPPTGLRLRYEFDDEDRMTAILEPGVDVHNFYDHDLCIRQTVAMRGRSGEFKFNYIFDAQKKHTKTEVNEPDGTLRRVTFDTDGDTLMDTRHAGRFDEASLNYELNPRTKAVESLTVSCKSTGAKVKVPGPFTFPQSDESTNDYESFLSICKPPGMSHKN
jgi:YD repeat-containing protein